jgi:hypothetical protein
MRCRFLAFLFALLLWGGFAQSAWAAGRVELTVSVEQDAPLTAQQTWVRELGEAGVRSVRFRAGRTGDRVGIETRGTQDSPIYVVTGTLNARSEVVLPGARFRQGDADRLARWLKDVAEQGPPETREPTAAFGLRQSEFAQLRKDLARPVDFSTQGQSRGEVIAKIRDRLGLPVQVDSALLSSLDKDKVEEQLQGISCGTALAYVLRSPGLGLMPRTSAKGPELVIGEARRDEKVWPIGWPPEEPGPKVAPVLFELHTINIENVSVAKVLEEVRARVKIPILLDHNALARYGIDPAKTLVTLPRRQTSYTQVLQKALFEARLQSELRVDESGKPLVWVTSVKPFP